MARAALTSAAAARPALAAVQTARRGTVLPAMIRADFPGASAETYLHSAAIHPLGTFAASAIEQTMAYRLRGPGPGRADFGVDKQNDLKARFAKMIGAKPTEIAFVSSTSDGENIVTLGLDLPEKKGNVVLDELQGRSLVITSSSADLARALGASESLTQLISSTTDEPRVAARTIASNVPSASPTTPHTSWRARNCSTL